MEDLALGLAAIVVLGTAVLVGSLLDKAIGLLSK